MAREAGAWYKPIGCDFSYLALIHLCKKNTVCSLYDVSRSIQLIFPLSVIISISNHDTEKLQKTVRIFRLLVVVSLKDG